MVLNKELAGCLHRSRLVRHYLMNPSGTSSGQLMVLGAWAHGSMTVPRACFSRANGVLDDRGKIDETPWLGTPPDPFSEFPLQTEQIRRLGSLRTRWP